ncbi:4a-hydroxytetrahydrobiopterin dehydratase [Lewinella sp. W8]|uniref:4a-hydroxytetrahydrobiopterin dehydratase n=1 Tax=Lewinella sp. W8 TaxID=2528208 RepID=UPI0010677244|nr:4a-hydroxytetrahydrobiopterin dehydratase [Lewinella sp. W8]MTB51944.1 pterin-4-alpha-carbinolamine dehydratase [Lewinella sp. W8]
MPWTEKDHALHREFTFENFTSAFAFMTEVAFAAEAAGHHPEWTNVYNRVTIRLTTHDAGNTVTDKDRQLATAINLIYAKHG